MLLGVDAGGSHIECATSGSDLVISGRELISPAPRAATDPTGLAKAIFEAGTRLQADPGKGFDRIAVGAAGTGDPAVLEALRSAISNHWPKASLAITSDITIALEDCFPSEPGILLAAGTGSFAVRRNIDGSVKRVGGLGPQIGDRGSAFDMGKAALVLSIKSPLASPGLTAALQSSIGTPTFEETLAAATPGEIAHLARAVCRAADGGDGAAARLVDDAARELMVLVGQLGDGTSRLPVAFTGGLVATEGSPVRELLIGLLEHSPRFDYRDILVDPVAGALSIASRLT